MILFGGGYECIKKTTDAGGRFALVVLESNIILADRLLLLKCYDNKMVKLPG